MRRRLDIAASIVITPQLLFLDEPTTGLDPRSRNQVWEIVRVLVGEGTTVLLTTQHLEEADELAGRIAIIDRGQVIAEGTSGELKKLVGTGSLRVRLHDPSQRAARVADPDRVAHALSDLFHAGVTLDEFSLGQPSLDEVFLTLTGHPAEPTEEVAA
jgi:ABC-2 type transport system ATP-binding protein